jgi:dTDP-4-amino-4,6-dideoxygalactose transaminase
MQRLEEIAAAHGVSIIEDAAQAHGARIGDKTVGGSNTSCFSFYPTKNMTTGEGGIITTNHPDIAEQARLWRNHGQPKRYYQTALGFNQRMTNLQAAIGNAQLKKLEQFNEQRIANARFLTEHLKDFVQTPVARPGYRHIYHQYTIRVPENRDQWVTTLHERGVGTGVHYPLAIYQQPFYQNSRSRFRISAPDGASNLPETEAAAKQVLSLPVHPALSQEDLATIVKEVVALCN